MKDNTTAVIQFTGGAFLIMFAIIGFCYTLDSFLPGPTVVKATGIEHDHECVLRIDPTLTVIVRDDHPLCDIGKVSR